MGGYPKTKKLYVEDLLNTCDEGEEKKNQISYNRMYITVTKRLNYKCRRTTIKTQKLIDDENILMNFIFHKVFCRACLNGCIPIYIDEAGFQIVNSKFYMWRLKEEEFYGGSKN